MVVTSLGLAMDYAEDLFVNHCSLCQTSDIIIEITHTYLRSGGIHQQPHRRFVNAQTIKRCHSEFIKVHFTLPLEISIFELSFVLHSIRPFSFSSGEQNKNH